MAFDWDAGLSPEEREWRQQERLRRQYWQERREAKARCAAKGHPEAQSWLVVTRKNVRIVQIRCEHCDTLVKVRGATLQEQLDLPIRADNRCQHCQGEGCERCTDHPCERCGSRKGIENHHWAPQSMFDDAWQWPQSYLCKTCHDEWHERVTPEIWKNIRAIRSANPTKYRGDEIL